MIERNPVTHQKVTQSGEEKKGSKRRILIDLKDTIP